jgi:hypothetical protein
VTAHIHVEYVGASSPAAWRSACWKATGESPRSRRSSMQPTCSWRRC